MCEKILFADHETVICKTSADLECVSPLRQDFEKGERKPLKRSFPLPEPLLFQELSWKGDVFLMGSVPRDGKPAKFAYDMMRHLCERVKFADQRFCRTCANLGYTNYYRIAGACSRRFCLKKLGEVKKARKKEKRIGSVHFSFLSPDPPRVILSR